MRIQFQIRSLMILAAFAAILCTGVVTYRRFFEPHVVEFNIQKLKNGTIVATWVELESVEIEIEPRGYLFLAAVIGGTILAALVWRRWRHRTRIKACSKNIPSPPSPEDVTPPASA